MPTIATPRGLTRRWLLPDEPAPGPTPPGLPPLVARILAARGLHDPAAADRFLRPSLNHLHDPSLIPDLDRAAERILAALHAREPLVIYGDYDVDGITATAILFHTLRTLAPEADIRTYVPHRLEEGYGLNAAALTQLAAEGARVVVSVDCGISALEPARAARAAGLDLIITDHHTPPEGDLPDALAIVHPRRPGSAYPDPDLCGAGVAYKLAWRLATLHCGGRRVRDDLRALLIELLALAALGTIADIVPLTGENRVIARFGLRRIKHSPLPGLRALVEASGLDGENIDAEHAGFALGPRLNACGRLGHAREAVALLTTATPEEASDIAHALTRLNDERRALEQRIARHAAELAEAAGMTAPGCHAIVLAHEEWHPGVLGIACSRLVERFGRPTILLCTRAEGEGGGRLCAGSGRSIAGFGLHDALTRCATHLAGYGGHAMAAGLRLDPARLDAFTRDFTAHANERLTPDELVPSVSIDTRADLAELTPDAVAQLESLAPFGCANPRPRILLEGLRAAGPPSPFGRAGNHLSLLARQGNRTVRLIAWNWAERRDALLGAATLDAVVSPRLNTWNGRTTVEPTIEDLRIAPQPAITLTTRRTPAPV